MSIKCIKVNEMDERIYTKFLTQRKEATVFHTLEWCRVIEDCLSFTTYFIVAIDRTNRIHAVLPLSHVNNRLNRKLYSLPLSPYCGYVGDKKYFKKVFERAIELKDETNCDYITIVQPPLTSVNNKMFSYMEERRWITQYIPIDDPRVLWSKFNVHTRRIIKKAIKSGIHVRRVDENDEKSIKKIYFMQVEFGKKKGFLNLSYRDYLKMWKRLHSAKLLETYVAEIHDEIIGFISFLKFGDKILCKSGVSTKKGRKLGAHRIIIWKMLKQSYYQGYKIFDFGPSSPLDRNGEIDKRFKGLINFKSSFGSNLAYFSYYYFPKAPTVDHMNCSTFSREVGKFVIKHIPNFVLSRISTFLIRSYV